MDWKECHDRRYIKPASVNEDLIASLNISADKRYQTASRLVIDEITAATVFSLYYDCVRELLEALAIKHRFKIYNHDCFCAFLKEVLNKQSIGDKFDRFRKIKNGINYYGKDLDIDTALELITDLKDMIEYVKRIS
ncbi:hypothetical protein HQ545_05955 [Candidatus Woesearchaeota archaeon]|nr:hypothetical protein [Candidatus Woesearchaeota archaeon]